MILSITDYNKIKDLVFAHIFFLNMVTEMDRYLIFKLHYYRQNGDFHRQSKGVDWSIG